MLAPPSRPNLHSILRAPWPSALAPAAWPGPRAVSGPAAIPRREPDRALAPLPLISADDCPAAPGTRPPPCPCARSRGWAGGPTGHPTQGTGDMPITDSRSRFHRLAQNPDLCWRYPLYGPASSQIDGVHRLAANCKSFPDRTQANNPQVGLGSISSRQDH